MAPKYLTAGGKILGSKGTKKQEIRYSKNANVTLFKFCP
jgi:hypothetical protein